MAPGKRRVTTRDLGPVRGGGEEESFTGPSVASSSSVAWLQRQMRLNLRQRPHFGYVLSHSWPSLLHMCNASVKLPIFGQVGGIYVPAGDAGSVHVRSYCRALIRVLFKLRRERLSLSCPNPTSPGPFVVTWRLYAIRYRCSASVRLRAGMMRVGGRPSRGSTRLTQEDGCR